MTARPESEELTPAQRLSYRMFCSANDLSAAVNHNAEANDKSELEDWFRVGYLVEVAKLLREADDEMTRLRVALAETTRELAVLRPGSKWADAEWERCYAARRVASLHTDTSPAPANSL